MKNIYNAASAFTTIMNNMLNRSIAYNNFDTWIMNQDILDQNNLADEETEKNPTVNKEDKQT